MSEIFDKVMTAIRFARLIQRRGRLINEGLAKRIRNPQETMQAAYREAVASERSPADGRASGAQPDTMARATGLETDPAE